ncbi:MAG: ABC transporter substrate-binding protein [Armatimonadota bacterium]|nr:ABC transporter substrate-binding protein [Armatimonadota bacterium]MDR5702272.1 ABC transporter substrate-binding protein [Armatimonadota bacterium]
MGTMRQRILFLLLPVVILPLLSMGPVFAQNPIVIGSFGPFSPPGSIAQWSEAVDGIKLAVEMINERGGVLGRPIRVQFEDSAGIPERGRAAVERLITQHKVPAIVGGNHSSVCLAVTEIVHARRIPFINVNCWANAIREKGYPEVFNTAVVNARIAVAGAYFIRHLGSKTVVAFAENTDFGIGLAQALGSRLKAIAPDVRYTYTILDREAKDFAPAILGFAQRPPDVVVTIMDPPAGYIIINQLKEFGVAPTPRTWLLDLDALAELPDFWDNVEEAGKFLTGIALFHPAMKLTDLGQSVRERHKKRTGREASRLVFQGFDAMWVMADAIKRAGSLEAGAIIKALRATNLVGTRGRISFSLERGPFFQQWVEVPFAIIQFTEVKQPLERSTIVFPLAQATGTLRRP